MELLLHLAVMKYLVHLVQKVHSMMVKNFLDELVNYFQNLDELVQGHLNLDVVEFRLGDQDLMEVAEVGVLNRHRFHPSFP